MKRENRLSENLRAYQKMRGYTQAELSRELGIPPSTLQTLMRSGNTTLDTLMQLSDSMDASLDELVYSQSIREYERMRQLLDDLERYADMSHEERKRVWYHLSELARIAKRENETA